MSFHDEDYLSKTSWNSGFNTGVLCGAVAAVLICGGLLAAWQLFLA